MNTKYVSRQTVFKQNESIYTVTSHIYMYDTHKRYTETYTRRGRISNVIFKDIVYRLAAWSDCVFPVSTTGCRPLAPFLYA